jgi:hypothetical protein
MMAGGKSFYALLVDENARSEARHIDIQSQPGGTV